MSTYFSCSSCDAADLCERCFIDLSPCHQPGTCTALACWVCQPDNNHKPTRDDLASEERSAQR